MSQQGISRREMMKWSAGALMAAGLWPGAVRGEDAPAVKPLKFVQVNDLHYTEAACTPFFEKLIADFNKIDDLGLVLVVGDLVQTGTIEECTVMRDILKKLKAPYRVTIGNHDAAGVKDRAPFDEVFGKDLNVSFDVNGWQFVGLDTSDYRGVSGFDCHKETLDFVAGLPAKLDKAKPTFVYTHFPLGPGVQNRLKNADAVLTPFKEINLTAVFNGHFHGFTQKTVRGIKGPILATTNVCCSRKVANHDNSWQKGYFVVEAADGGYKRTFVPFGEDMDGVARSGKKPDKMPVNPPASQPAF